MARRVVGWGLTGTLLMIAGMVVLHLAGNDPEDDAGDPPA